MEDVTEDAVVDEVVFRIVGLDEVAHIMVEEPQLTAQILADGCRADTTFCRRQSPAENVDDGRCLLDGLW